MPLLISPTDSLSSPIRMLEREPGTTTRVGLGQAIGTTAHRILQYWDFQLDVGAQLALINRELLVMYQEHDEVTQEVILEEVRDLLGAFVQSPVYERLRRATVVGREVPLLMPWNEGRQVMEGVIDLLYRLNGELWIADYKTDTIPLDQIAVRAEHYREQARLYRMAVEQSLGAPVAGFEFIFLRHGTSVRW